MIERVANELRLVGKIHLLHEVRFMRAHGFNGEIKALRDGRNARSAGEHFAGWRLPP